MAVAGSESMQDRAAEAAVPNTYEPLSPRAWYAVVLLTIVYAVHTMDRQVLTVLLEPIKAELLLTDTQLGFLAGIAYAVAFAIAGIPLGMLCDRVNRRKLLSALIAVWSLLTAMSGLAQSYFNLILARIGVGLAESGGMPASLSLIADYVPRSRRSAAAGIFMSGTGLGALAGMAIAAVVAANYGWRAAFFVAGLPGILLALVVFMTLREPSRNQSVAEADKRGAVPLASVLKFVIHQRSMVLMLSGTVMAVLANAGVATWMTSFLMRVHGLNLAHAGIATAVVSGLTSIAGSLLGAYCSDRLGSRDIRWQPRFTAAVTFGAGVAVVCAAMAASVWGAVLSAALWGLLFPCFHATAFGLSTSLAPRHMRGTSVAVLAVLNNVVGYGLGPQIVGILSDVYGEFFGLGALRYALASVALCYGVAALLFLAASGRRLLQDLDRAGA